MKMFVLTLLPFFSLQSYAIDHAAIFPKENSTPTATKECPFQKGDFAKKVCTCQSQFNYQGQSYTLTVAYTMPAGWTECAWCAPGINDTHAVLSSGTSFIDEGPPTVAAFNGACGPCFYTKTIEQATTEK